MPTLVTCRGLSKAYHSRPLFRGLALSIDDADRVGLIGPNGAGKSTLLKIIAGLDTPDDGELTLRTGVRIAYLAQEDRFAPGATVETALTGPTVDSAGGGSDGDAAEVTGRTHNWVDGPGSAHAHIDPHEQQVRVRRMLSRCGFSDLAQPVAALSGGWRKRLAIARALLSDPDLLLLDEPTNHLDLEGIAWLEKTLADAGRPSSSSATIGICLKISHIGSWS